MDSMDFEGSTALKFGRTLGCGAGLVLLLGACTPYNIPIRVETNKTAAVMNVDDGRQVITMGSPYTYVEKPDVDWAQARVDAAAMCRKRTGKAAAEPVGATRRECVKQMGTNCVQYAIMGDYRCVEASDE